MYWSYHNVFTCFIVILPSVSTLLQAHREREEEGDEFDDKEAFVTSSYRKKMEELEADEQRLKKEEEYNGKHWYVWSL